MSLIVALIIIIALVVVLFGALALVMSRPKDLRAHRPGWRGSAWTRRGRRRGRPGSTA
jgi:hypothetical protein